MYLCGGINLCVCFPTGKADDFHYTKQGRNPVIDGVDDAKEMSTTRNAFTLLGQNGSSTISHVVESLMHKITILDYNTVSNIKLGLISSRHCLKSVYFNLNVFLLSAHGF